MLNISQEEKDKRASKRASTRGSTGRAFALLTEFVQNKVFTRWMSYKLKLSQPLDTTEELFIDGTRLCKLVEILSGSQIKGKISNPPKNKSQFLENFALALKHVEADGLRLTISADDFMNKKDKLINGFIWTLFLKYSLPEGKDNFLIWLNSTIQKKYPHINEVDFGTTWFNGITMAALVNCFAPDSIDISKLNTGTDDENKEANLHIVFKTAEQALGIPLLLSPSEFLEGEERTLITYLSLFKTETSPKPVLVVSEKCTDCEENKKLLETTRNELVEKKNELGVARNELEIAKNELEIAKNEIIFLKQKLAQEETNNKAYKAETEEKLKAQNTKIEIYRKELEDTKEELKKNKNCFSSNKSRNRRITLK